MEKIASIDNKIIQYKILESDEMMKTHQIVLPAGKKLVVENDGKMKPSFIMVGSGNKNKESRAHSMDYTEELLNMTKPEGFMFKLLMKNRNNVDEFGYKKSNITHIDSSTLNVTEKQYIKIAYKTLREKDLVVRYKRGSYIINPRLVVSQDNWEREELLYKEACSKKTN